MNTKIFLAIPTNRGIKGLTAESIIKMILFRPELFSGVNVATEGYTVAENRNCLVARAIRAGATHILFIDDDMVVPEDTAVKLLSYGKDIMGVKYHPRQVSSNNVDGMFMAIAEDKDITDDIFRCVGVGGGILLINLEIFKNLERPWFDWITYDTGMIKMGEDFYFCDKARKAGYEVWADRTLNTGHIGDFVY